MLRKGTKYEENLRDLNPSNLRRELADMFHSDNKFQLQKIDDPSEALFVFLNALHAYVFDVKSLKFIIDRPCNPNCISHEFFWPQILEQTVKNYFNNSHVLVGNQARLCNMTLVTISMNQM
jgi:hypothetical protein